MRGPLGARARQAPFRINVPASEPGGPASPQRGMIRMNTDGRSGPSSRPRDYSQLNDEQLRSAIRFAEKRLCWTQEEHVELMRAYSEEIEAMRRHLFDRVLMRLVTNAAPLSAEQRDRLLCAFERHGLGTDDVARLISATTKGRAREIGGLTEIEAMGLLMRLEREA